MAGGGYSTKTGSIPAIKGSQAVKPIEGARASATPSAAVPSVMPASKRAADNINGLGPKDKYVVTNAKGQIVGRHATKAAARADGMARRRAGETAFSYSAKDYKKYINPRAA